jgi:hypothetical protein
MLATEVVTDGVEMEVVEAVVDGVVTEAVESVVDDPTTERSAVMEPSVATETGVDGADGPVAIWTAIGKAATDPSVTTETGFDGADGPVGNGTVVGKAATGSKNGATEGKRKARKKKRTDGVVIIMEERVDETVVGKAAMEPSVATETGVDGADGPVAIWTGIGGAATRSKNGATEAGVDGAEGPVANGKTGGKWKVKKKKGNMRREGKTGGKGKAKKKKGKTRREGTDGVDQLILRYTTLTKDDLSDLKAGTWGLSREQHEQCEAARNEVSGGRFSVLGDLTI